MKTNANLTVYHKGFDDITRLEKWTRYTYKRVWWFDNKKASLNQGYIPNNDVSIRIPYDVNPGLNINNFSRGDIIVKGLLNIDIQTQQDLKNYEVFNITSITNNKVGTQKHIHLGGA